MDICSALIGAIFVFVMIATIRSRRWLIAKAICKPSAALDSATGLTIIFAGALSLWCMRSYADEAAYVVSSEMAKLLASAIGAMYLKQGYEKHDQEESK